jgi:hypothetical protein
MNNRKLNQLLNETENLALDADLHGLHELAHRLRRATEAFICETASAVDGTPTKGETI